LRPIHAKDEYKIILPKTINLSCLPQNITQVWRIPIVSADLIDTAVEIGKKQVFTLDAESFKLLQDNKAALSVQMYSDIDGAFPLQFQFDPTPVDMEMGIIYATVVLLGLYIMIIWEIVHRTFAAIIASTMALGILAAMGERPTMDLLISWIDVETLLLLFGMMILVAILSETGIFDFLAVYAYKVKTYNMIVIIIYVLFVQVIR
jgi:P protein